MYSDTERRMIKSGVQQFMDREKRKNSAEKSWIHCYQAFEKGRKEDNPDIDYLCLHLTVYLVSWGMYRGSSFLTKRDYKVHRPVVEEILNSKYDSLYGIQYNEYTDEDIWQMISKVSTPIRDLYGEIRKTVYEDERKDTPESPVTDVLVTKVLMGTLGCVPAYDRYFIKGLEEVCISPKTFGKKSLNCLSRLYKEGFKDFEELRMQLSNEKFEYPQAKILDMALWQIGFNKLEGKEL